MENQEEQGYFYDRNENGIQLPNAFIQSIANRMVFSAVLWICIAIIQMLISIPLLLFAGYGLLTLGCGIWNLVMCIRELKYAKYVRSCSCVEQAGGIVRYFERSKDSCWIGILVNVFCGGVIGVAGNIYDLILCNYVVKNKTQIGVCD